MAEEWLTTAEADEISAYNLQYIRLLIRTGRLDARKFGDVWQVNRASLHNYLNAAKESGNKRRGPKE